MTPLAHLLRPTRFEDYIGQSHLVGKGKVITRMVEEGSVPSLLFWGPPGCGKTTLAQLIATALDAVFVSISAVESGTSDIKAIIQSAKRRRTELPTEPTHTILFIDEIHRFNKLQQDALLGAVEQGILTLFGATTENPGFSVIPALVSRCQVYHLQPHTAADMQQIITKAGEHLGLAKPPKEVVEFLISYGSGDARKIISAIELAASGQKKLTLAHLQSVLQSKTSRYDKGGEEHYDTISAFIKSMRGGSAEASLHYLARMIESGEDPVFIARRMVIFASEDVGNAQPTALVVATSCMQAVALIGMPEARIILAQCATYLATAKKSTASYDGISLALSDVQNLPWDPIPLHLRNAVNKVVKAEGYGAGHIRYPWKVTNTSDLSAEEAGHEDHHTVQQEYLPANLKGKKYYQAP